MESGQLFKPRAKRPRRFCAAMRNDDRRVVKLVEFRSTWERRLEARHVRLAINIYELINGNAANMSAIESEEDEASIENIRLP